MEAPAVRVFTSAALSGDESAVASTFTVARSRTDLAAAANCKVLSVSVVYDPTILLATSQGAGSFKKLGSEMWMMTLAIATS